MDEETHWGRMSDGSAVGSTVFFPLSSKLSRGTTLNLGKFSIRSVWRRRQRKSETNRRPLGLQFTSDLLHLQNNTRSPPPTEIFCDHGVTPEFDGTDRDAYTVLASLLSLR